MVFYILQIIVTLLLIGVVLLQSQGSGLSGAFGGTGEMFRSKRSVEKLLTWATALLALLFALLSIIILTHH